MADPIQRAAGRGCATQLLVLFVAPAIAFGMMALAAGVAAIVPAEGPARMMIFLVVFSGLAVCFGAAALLYAAKRTKVLDGAFGALGIPPTSVVLNVREYHGALHGRAVDALFARRGPRLELHVETRVQAALAVGTSTALGRWVAGAANLPPFQLPDPAFASLVVSSDDPQWAQQVLRVPAIRDAVLRMVQDPTGQEMRVFAVRPEAVKLSRSYFDPDACAAEIEPMLRMLYGVAAELERLPPPARPTPLSDFERKVRKGMGRSVVWIVLGFFAVVLVLLLAAALAAVFLLQ